MTKTNCVSFCGGVAASALLALGAVWPVGGSRAVAPAPRTGPVLECVWTQPPCMPPRPKPAQPRPKIVDASETLWS